MSDYLNLGGLWGTQPTPAFNNQQIPLSTDLLSGITANTNNYMSANPMAGMGGLGSTDPLGNLSGMGASFLQGKNADGSTYGGWGQAGAGIAQGLGSMYLGMKNYGLQKDQLAFGKEQFNKNYSAQKTMTNNQINARNQANQAALGTKYASSYKPLDLVA